jgi:hypothetical protein
MHKRLAVGNSAINVGFSGIRFILQLVLFAKLSDEVIADWGIASQIILMLSFWSGLELHYLINRNFVQGEERVELVRERTAFAAVLCLVVGIAGYRDSLGFGLTLASVALVDYLVVETIRMLNVIGKYIFGSLITNLRGVWMIPPLFFKSITLTKLLVIYGVSSGVLLVFAVGIGLHGIRIGSTFEVRRFVQRAVQSSGFMLLGVYGAAEPVLSRLIVDNRYGESALAMFVVFWSIISGLQIVLGSLILQPQLGSVLTGNSRYRATDVLLAVALLAGFLAGAFHFLDVFLGLIDKSHFSGNLPVLSVVAMDVTAQFVVSMLVYNVHAKGQASRLLLMVTGVKVMAMMMFAFVSQYYELWQALLVLFFGSAINVMIGALQVGRLRRFVYERHSV